MAMYFTRAQADELAALFDQQYLQGLTAAGGAGGDDDYDDEYGDETEIQSENETQAEEY
jgi:hypothetical protein